MECIITSEKEISSVLHKMRISFEKSGNKYTIDDCVEIYKLKLLAAKMLGKKNFSIDFEYSFDDFMKRVDRILIMKTGLTHSDFEDYDWMAEYESDCNPRDSVSEFLLQLEESF